jgi:hypothetical protein
MEKRYQVFVSSTYADLKEERQRVIQTLMEMDCIPSGMELFPAVDEEQWEFIKRVIDDCDYYLLIIGGRYGSTTSEGISYTEKEYDYAIEKGLKVIALIHEKPNELSVEKSDINPELRERLDSFREKAKTNRLVKFWNAANELPGLVALSVSKTIKTYPAIGWVRANQTSSTELLTEVNELRKRNDELEKELEIFQKKPKNKIANLASLKDVFVIHGNYKQHTSNSYLSWKAEVSWGNIFALISPYLLQPQNDAGVSLTLAKVLFEKYKGGGTSPGINDQTFQTIKIQLMALDLIEVKSLKTTKGGVALFWCLTKNGKDVMMSIRTIKTPKPKD